MGVLGDDRLAECRDSDDPESGAPKVEAAALGTIDLRMTLRNSEEPEVPLRTELEMLELYIDIMKGRFQDSRF